MIKNSKVVFVNKVLQNSFDSIDEEDWLKKNIFRSITHLKENAFAGVHIPKRQIPKYYIDKYGVDNLWKYDLPKGWRILYTVISENEVQLLSVILEWFDHKDYERRFHY